MNSFLVPRRAQRQQEVHRKREPPGFEVPVSRICKQSLQICCWCQGEFVKKSEKWKVSHMAWNDGSLWKNSHLTSVMMTSQLPCFQRFVNEYFSNQMIVTLQRHCYVFSKLILKAISPEIFMNPRIRDSSPCSWATKKRG